MGAQTFAQIMITLVAIASGFSLFLNFLLLLIEEMKKYSIMNRKKKDCPVWFPESHLALGRDGGH